MGFYILLNLILAFDSATDVTSIEPRGCTYNSNALARGMKIHKKIWGWENGRTSGRVPTEACSLSAYNSHCFGILVALYALHAEATLRDKAMGLTKLQFCEKDPNTLKMTRLLSGSARQTLLQS